MLKISKEKLAHVISTAREYEEHAGQWDQVVQNSFNDIEISPLADELQAPAANFSLAEFLEELNVPEKASLIALAMIGRCEVDAQDFDQAMAKAIAEDAEKAATYLLRIPMVAEYLEDGLQKLGDSLNAWQAPELQNA